MFAARARTWVDACVALANDAHAVVAITRRVVLAVTVAWVIRAVLPRLVGTPTGRRRSVPQASAGTRAVVKKAVDVDARYTTSDVAKHATVDDLWVIIDGKVYDLSEYAHEHPGGTEAIAKHAGGDASVGFKGPQHPRRVFDMVTEYQIGVLS